MRKLIRCQLFFLFMIFPVLSGFAQDSFGYNDIAKWQLLQTHGKIRYMPEYGAFGFLSTNSAVFRLYTAATVADSNLIFRISNYGSYSAVELLNSGVLGVKLTGQGNVSAKSITLNGSTKTNWNESDPLAASLRDGTTPFNALTLDQTIYKWSDLLDMLTDVANVVWANSEITSTNDSVWTGWTTDGDLLTNGVIWLTEGEYLESPAQTNGIARYAVESSSDANGTSYTLQALVGTNQVSVPYYGTDAVIRVVCGSGMPGALNGLNVSSASITGYGDLSKAANKKYVAGLRVIDQPSSDADAVPKWYADAIDTRQTDYTDAQINGYAADSTKVLRGAQVRLGNGWTSTASGGSFILSYGDGSAVSTSNGLVLAHNDYPLLTLSSGSSGLYIASHSMTESNGVATFTLNIDTNGVIAEPYAEYTSDLMTGEWTRIDEYATNSYPSSVDGYYVLTFSAPLETAVFIRAMQATSGSAVIVNANTLNLSGGTVSNVTEIVFANGAKLVISSNTLEIVNAP